MILTTRVLGEEKAAMISYLMLEAQFHMRQVNQEEILRLIK
jgi:hypothetical protein